MDVKLIDGRVVDSASEEWRIECLARSIAGRPHINQRRDAMKSWQLKMSKEAFKKFSALVVEIYNNEFFRGFK